MKIFSLVSLFPGKCLLEIEVIVCNNYLFPLRTSLSLFLILCFLIIKYQPNMLVEISLLGIIFQRI